MLTNTAITHSVSARTRRAALGLVLLFAVLAVGYLPLLIRFASEQWARPQYQFFPLILLAALVIGWQRVAESHKSPLVPSASRVAPLLLLLSLALFIGASALWYGRLAAASLLLTVVTLSWVLGGRRLLRALAPSLILLALVVGPPAVYEEVLLQRLREFAVAISGGVLILLGIPHLTTGTVIEIPGSRLLVAEACSGINSLMAVLGCTMVIGFLRRRSARVLLMLLACGVLFVLWANVARIAGGVWLKTTYDIDILSGAAHETASLVLFSACIVMVLCTDEAAGLLRWLLKENVMFGPATEPAPNESPLENQPPALTRTAPGLWAMAFAIALIGVGSLFWAHTHGGISRWLEAPAASHLREGAAFTAPGELGAWKRSEEVEKHVAQPEMEGTHSQVWAYRKGATVALLAIDYPFAGHHDLAVCYRNGGWNVLGQTHKNEADGPVPGQYVLMELGRLNEHGAVWYSALEEEGTWAQPRGSTVMARVQRRLQYIGRPDWNGATYQVQLFVQAYEPFTDEQRRALEDFFLNARRELGSQVLEQLEGRPQ